MNVSFLHFGKTGMSRLDFYWEKFNNVVPSLNWEGSSFSLYFKVEINKTLLRNVIVNGRKNEAVVFLEDGGKIIINYDDVRDGFLNDDEMLLREDDNFFNQRVKEIIVDLISRRKLDIINIIKMSPTVARINNDVCFKKIC